MKPKIRRVDFKNQWLADLNLKHGELVEVDGRIYRYAFAERAKEHSLELFEPSNRS